MLRVRHAHDAERQLLQVRKLRLDLRLQLERAEQFNSLKNGKGRPRLQPWAPFVFSALFVE